MHYAEKSEKDLALAPRSLQRFRIDPHPLRSIGFRKGNRNLGSASLAPVRSGLVLVFRERRGSDRAPHRKPSRH